MSDRRPKAGSGEQDETKATLFRVEAAKSILVEGLRYYAHDGHTMPKKVARDALEALGVKLEDQP